MTRDQEEQEGAPGKVAHARRRDHSPLCWRWASSWCFPTSCPGFLEPLVPSYHVRTVIEGFVRIGIFIVYILLISRTEDIQRTFMYHGAEHKCINCIEHGLPLTVENVRASSRQHKRCGTSFLFFVLLISIILLLLVQVESPVMRVVPCASPFCRSSRGSPTRCSRPRETRTIRSSTCSAGPGLAIQRADHKGAG